MVNLINTNAASLAKEITCDLCGFQDLVTSGNTCGICKIREEDFEDAMKRCHRVSLMRGYYLRTTVRPTIFVLVSSEGLDVGHVEHPWYAKLFEEAGEYAGKPGWYATTYLSGGFYARSIFAAAMLLVTRDWQERHQSRR